MQPSDFTSLAPGRLEPTEAVETYLEDGKPKARRVRGWGFVPNPLPPNIPAGELLLEVLDAVLAAERNLSQLEGAASQLDNQYLLMGVFSQREAIYSSQIENTFATPAELAIVDHAPEQLKDRAAVQEVRNYVHALEHGLASPLPISGRLIREMHRCLLDGLPRSAGVAPGEFRRSQNYIGPVQSFAKARFVPPPPQFLESCLRDFDSYVNSHDTQTPRLVRFAFAHYQFETIHPFGDGNGRLGRLLIALMLCRDGQLSRPLVYVSKYFEQERARYYQLLYDVSTKGVWVEWVRFFLEAVATQAHDALQRASRIVKLRDEFLSRVEHKRASSLLPPLIRWLFEQPSVTPNQVVARLSCSPATASSLLRKLEDVGIVREATGRERGRVFVASELLALILDDESS